MSDTPNWNTLTPAEQDLVNEINNDPSKTNEILVESLKEHLQIAVEIELATIPIYLYTYYSLLRGTDTATGAQGTWVDRYVIQAGGTIMSVAVEEMLHMSLASNILNSLGQHPSIYGKSPDLPGVLPLHADDGGPSGHEPIEFHLDKLSWKHLYQFLQIELPEAYNASPQGSLYPVKFGGPGWDTIGQFYSYIRCLIHANVVTDGDFQNAPEDQQLDDDNYAPNNIDTVYPNDPGYDRAAIPSAPHSAASTAEYPNNRDSHEGNEMLQTVNSKDTALIAIATICDEGEGYKHTDTDDSEANEDSHFVKFYDLRSWLEPDASGEPVLDWDNVSVPKPADPVLKPGESLITESQLEEIEGGKSLALYPRDPKTANYPAEYQAISNVCNAIYSYMLKMTEMSYKVAGAEQKEMFNIGMHKAMIWILDKIILGMRGVEITTGDYAGCVLAPTFENYAFTTDDPKQELWDLCQGVLSTGNAASKNVLSSEGIVPLIADLPDVTLKTYDRGPNEGETYVSFATPTTSA